MKEKVRTWYAKEWIKHKGLRQKDVVAGTDYNKSQVSDYVNGKRRWNEDVLFEFAKFLRCDPSDLLTPPNQCRTELVKYVMKMQPQLQDRALKILKAALGDEVGIGKAA